MGTQVVAGRTGTTARARTGTGRRVRRIVIVLGIVVVVLVAAGYFGVSAYVADKLSRPERKGVVSSPAQHGLTYKDVTFRSTVDDIQLSGWLIDSPGKSAIVMLHGRDQTRESDEAYLEKASIFVREGYDVLMFDFRAHGRSGGERYAFGQWETRDLAGALKYLGERGYSRVGTYGVSMGAAISLLAAPEHPEIEALWADSPYSNLMPLIEKKLPESSGLPALFNPGILWMAGLMYGIDFSTVRPVEALAGLGDRPVYHVHSQEGDDWVPLSQARELEQAGAANPNFTSWIAPGKGHVSAYTNNKEEYTHRMLAFYARYLK